LSRGASGLPQDLCRVFNGFDRPSFFRCIAMVQLGLDGWLVVGSAMAVTKKRDVRRSVKQAGWITLEGGFAARPCTVMDLSATGAKITLDDPSSVSASRIRLAFTRDARTGRACEVVWRRGKTLGVRFVA
jgi:hypothetical protein